MADRPTPETLRVARAENPKARARDLAASLGVTEAELVAAFVGDTAVAISPDPAALLPLVSGLGDVLALTRNSPCVNERRSRYGAYDGAQRRVQGDGLVLEVMPDHWAYGFAVADVLADGGLRRSLQIFDQAGDAVHKIYLQSTSDLGAWDGLLNALRLPVQSTGLSGLVPEVARAASSAPHPAGATVLARTAVTTLLHAAAEDGISLSIRVGNAGCIQTHEGPIHKVLPMGPWINVMDPLFNLHLRTDKVAKVLSLADGDAVEAFDAQGELILRMMPAKAGADNGIWAARVAAAAEPQIETPAEKAQA